MSYAHHAAKTGEELLELLSRDDGELLRADLVELTEDGWLAWEYENRTAANAFLRATPAEREKRKAWKDPVLRCRLAFAAHRQARLAVSILAAQEYLGPGGGYRETTAAAAAVAFELFREARWRWPLGATAPFPEWQGVW